MTKASKILISLIVVLMLVAATTTVMAIGDINPEPITGSGVELLGEKILGYIQVVGNIVAVGTILVLAIKYMMGSTAEKAEYKKTFIPYLVGIVLLVGAVNIAKMMSDFGEKATQDLTGDVDDGKNTAVVSQIDKD